MSNSIRNYVNGRDQRVQVNISLKGEMRDLLMAHHNALVETGLDGTVTDTARSLILEALSAHSGGVLVSAAARRAHMRVYTWTLSRARTFFEDQLREVENQISVMESAACPCCGRPMSEHDKNQR